MSKQEQPKGKHPSELVFPNTEEGLILHPLTEPKPVVDSFKGKYTAVSLVPYFLTTELLISRRAGDPTLIGYCVENPLEVLEAAFPDYHVTRLNNREFFDIKDFEQTNPMLGLGIRGIRPVFGIDGKIEQMLQLDKVLKVKRDKPISVEGVQRITARLKSYVGSNDGKIIDVLERCV